MDRPQFWRHNDWTPHVGQRVRKHAFNAFNAANMLQLPAGGTVVEVIDRHSIKVLCDGRTEAERFAIALWEPES